MLSWNEEREYAEGGGNGALDTELARGGGIKSARGHVYSLIAVPQALRATLLDTLTLAALGTTNRHHFTLSHDFPRLAPPESRSGGSRGRWTSAVVAADEISHLLKIQLRETLRETHDPWDDVGYLASKELGKERALRDKPRLVEGKARGPRGGKSEKNPRVIF